MEIRLNSTLPVMQTIAPRLRPATAVSAAVQGTTVSAAALTAGCVAVAGALYAAANGFGQLSTGIPTPHVEDSQPGRCSRH